MIAIFFMCLRHKPLTLKQIIMRLFSDRENKIVGENAFQHGFVIIHLIANSTTLIAFPQDINHGGKICRVWLHANGSQLLEKV